MADPTSRPLSAVTGESHRAPLEETHQSRSKESVSDSEVKQTPSRRKRPSTSSPDIPKKIRKNILEQSTLRRTRTRSRDSSSTLAQAGSSGYASTSTRSDSPSSSSSNYSYRPYYRGRAKLRTRDTAESCIAYSTRSKSREQFNTTQNNNLSLGTRTRASESADKIQSNSRSSSVVSATAEELPRTRRSIKAKQSIDFLHSVNEKGTPSVKTRKSKKSPSKNKSATASTSATNASQAGTSSWTAISDTKSLKKSRRIANVSNRINSSEPIASSSKINITNTTISDRRSTLRSFRNWSSDNLNSTIGKESFTIETETSTPSSSSSSSIAGTDRKKTKATRLSSQVPSPKKRLKISDESKSKSSTSLETASVQLKHKTLNLGARLGRGSREPLENVQGGPSGTSSGPQQNSSLLRRSTRGEHFTMPAPREKKKKDKGKSAASANTGSCASSTVGSGGRRGTQKGTGQNSLMPQAGPSTSSAAMPTAETTDSTQRKDGAPPSPAEASGGAPLGLGQHPDSESDDSEVGRLQALLEARGLPPHLFGALGPRMQHLLHRSMGASSSTKAQQLLQGLQAGDESQQLQAVIEMCQMLVMGNEDTLAGFPVKSVVPALITLLGMEHNFDMMNHACRALTYMMEALPRSSGVVVDAVPIFLEKLQVIQCMDVAEQSLTALDMLSRRHSKAILQAGGVASCLMYLDFFSINAQRAALSITSNCCQNLHAEEFHFVVDSLSLLAVRLTQQDKKSVEYVCVAFSRLIDSYQHDPSRLQEIATPELLTNSQQLLLVSPPVISTGTFITVLRMLSVMCANCPDLALTLLRQNIADTLLYLLTGSSIPNKSDEIELSQRSPQELYEITCLIGELMPRLPTDGIFTVDSYLEKPINNVQDSVHWQWKDDRSLWHPYTSIDSRIIEAAYQNTEDEISLSTLGRTYTVDFHSMQQINEDTGTTRPVQRKINTMLLNESAASTSQPQNIENSNQSTSSLNLATRPSNSQRDARVACLREERGLAAAFIRSLFSVLYEVYSSSAGPAVRCKCLKALLRMVYYANADLLKEVMKNQIVSSHIAGMMASTDLRIVVGALQMADILMQKLPDVFGIHFRREGVMHQIKQLADPAIPLSVSPPKSANSSSASNNANIVQDVSTPSLSSTVATKSSLNTVKQEQQTSKSLSNSSKSKSVHHSASNSPRPSVSPTPCNTSSGFANTSNSSTANLNISINPNLSQPSGSHTTPPTLTSFNTASLSTSVVAGSSSGSSNVSTNGVIPIGAMSNAGLAYTSTPESRRYHAEMLADDRSQSPSQLRLSDVLKRKRVSKRPTLSTRPKSRPEDMNLSSSVMQDLFNKATSIGTAAAGRNTPTSSTSRSRFGGATSKTTSFFSSLNPARWGRQSTPHSSSYGKETINTTLNKSSSNPNLTAGNREKARTWVREQASLFMSSYSENEESGPPHPAMNILSRLTAAIQKLPCESSESLSALMELRDILIESDISPFEVNHSGLIRAMINYLSLEEGVIIRDDRLRAFLHVFSGCPLNMHHSGIIDEWNPIWFGALVTKLNGCVSQLEQFPVKVHDLPAGSGGGRGGGTSALKFFNTHQLKCNLQRHPDCNNLKQWKGGTVKIDPLALVQAIERYLVVRGYGRLRDKDTGESDEDNSEDDIDDTLAAVVISQGGSRHKLQFLIGDNILPYNMTVYQAVRQFSPSANDQSETDTDTETPLGNAGVWIQTHTIYYRPLPEESTCTKASNLQHTTRKGKTSSKTHIRRKGDELWNEGIVPVTQSSLTLFLRQNLPETVIIQDASLEVLCLLRILQALNRHWGVLYPALQYAPILQHSDFYNNKIAAKANRQLQDPLVIMTGNLPQWLHQIPAVCPFLFPFETRQLLFYATCFDRDRALQRLLDSTPELSSTDSTERVTPRLDRRKRTISREDILKQAEAVIQDLANSKALLEVQYENEVGTGLGPTLEFYALVSQELQRADLDLWHGSESFKQKSNISDVIKSNTLSDNFSGFDATLGPSLMPNEFKKADNSLQLLIENSNVDVQGKEVLTAPVNHTYPDVVSTNAPETGQSPESVAYVNNKTGLFPMALGRTTKVSQMSKIKSKFKFLGKFMAKAVMDSRMLDLPFSYTFYRWLLGQESHLGLPDLAHVAPEVHKTLVRLQEIVRQRDIILNNISLTSQESRKMLDDLNLDGCPIVDLGLDFILPGHATIELKKGGKDTPVTLDNLDQYIKLVTHWFLYEGVVRQMDAFREGFDSVFSLASLRMFYPEELEAVFCGSLVNQVSSGWDIKTLLECCRTDHGFNQDSRAIKFLFEIISSYNREEQRQFVQFITGSPRLPTGGFKALSPPLTIVRKTLEPNMNADDYLPSVMTCVNYLKLPDYSTIEVMRAKLKLAASEGQHSFHLS